MKHNIEKGLARRCYDQENEQERRSVNQYYDEIMNLIGAEEFKSLIQKWDQLSDNIRKNPPGRRILLPNLLWVGNSGIGRTKLLSLMSEYLCSKGNLMDFYGDVKCFEFLLGYTPKDQPFTELQRLEDELDVAAGFRSEFRGAILIDIDPWVNHYKELYFSSFMEYLSSHSDKWMIVLSVSVLPKEKLHNLESFLSMYLRFDKVTLTLPKADDLYIYVERKLGEYGLKLDSGARDLIVKTIGELCGSPYFDGFKSINMLCQDIVYEHFSTANAARDTLTAEDLAEFAPDSSYVKKVVKNSEQIREIGFARGEKK